jgi:hypothetical protein
LFDYGISEGEEYALPILDLLMVLIWWAAQSDETLVEMS